MKRTLYRADGPLAAAVLLLASCSVTCTTGGEADKATRQIAPEISARAGVPVEVTCPEFDPAKTNQCQASAQTGQTFSVEVKKGAGERWEWQPRGVDFGTAVAENITKLYAEAHGIQLPGLTCTPIVVEGSAEPPTCQARVQGVDVVFDVKPGPGGATFLPRRGFVVSSLAIELARDELAKLGIQAEVDCGPALRLSVPDSEFTCTVEDAAGDTRQIYFRVTDTDAGLRLRNKPFE
jgi:hypothetical protein